MAFGVRALGAARRWNFALNMSALLYRVVFKGIGAVSGRNQGIGEVRVIRYSSHFAVRTTSSRQNETSVALQTGNGGSKKTARANISKSSGTIAKEKSQAERHRDTRKA